MVDRRSKLKRIISFLLAGLGFALISAGLSGFSAPTYIVIENSAISNTTVGLQLIPTHNLFSALMITGGSLSLLIGVILSGDTLLRVAEYGNRYFGRIGRL